jgi:DUF1680 family protein
MTMGQKAFSQEGRGEQFLDPATISVQGELGNAINISENGRLEQLPSWNNGALIKMFSGEARENNKKQDWYGEHAGKWLYATSMAARRTGSKELKDLLFTTANYLISTQEANGYLGSYSRELRLTNKDNKIKNRSWDVWSLSYMTLGLLKLNEYFPNEKYLQAAKNIGSLFLATFGDGAEPVTDYGTRDGISATIILDPVIELYRITNDQRYLDFAHLIVKEMEAREGVKFISTGLQNGDMENIGSGKAYQIIWNLTALAKLYEVTGEQDILTAITNAWKNIADYHLTIAGGPWGGIGKFYECFNRKGFWDPAGFVETCSTMSWIQFNKELLKITGEAKYAAQIEKSAYNALQGAQFPNGVDWSYHTFSNGRRHIAHFDDCCPSSGALALEELPSVLYAQKQGGIACNLYAESEARISLPNDNSVRLAQHTSYPFDGKITLTLTPNEQLTFPVFIRIPEWAMDVSIRVNGKAQESGIASGDFYRIERNWKKGDKIDIYFPITLKIHQKSENATVPQGKTNIFDVNWFAVSAGPLVYATDGLINGIDRARTFKLPAENSVKWFRKNKAPEGYLGEAYELNLPGQKPLTFVPYYEAGGRKTGTWRLTWVERNVE